MKRGTVEKENNMICQNCGAEYKDQQLQCPYCRSENRTEAERQKARVLASYDREDQELRKEMKGYAGERAGRLTKWILCGVAALLVLAGLVTAGVILFGKLAAGHSYRQDQTHLKKLEEMYVQQDYAGIAEYVSQYGLWSAAYEKYEQIYEVQCHYSRLEEDLQTLSELAATLFSSEEEQLTHLETWAFYAAEEAAAVLSAGREYAEDNAILGNEACMSSFCEACSRLLLEAGCTEKEIQNASVQGEAGASALGSRILAYYTAAEWRSE